MCCHVPVRSCFAWLHEHACELGASIKQHVSSRAAAQVDSRESLAAAWAAQPAFLKLQLRAWLREGAAEALDIVWPRLLAEAAQK